jgi:adenylate cyclase
MQTDRLIATILFSNIVGSTERAAELGDLAWHDLLEQHHVLVCDALRHFEGEEIATAGEGFLAIFDAPDLAIRAACAIRDGAKELELEVLSGLHIGKVKREAGGDIGGIAVHVGARVAERAAAGEVLVTSGLRDAELGSGFSFEDRGSHELKGVPGEWDLYAVTGLPTEADEPISARRAGASDKTTQSIAVLPFANLSTDPDNEFFSEGVSDELINRLSRLPQLRVCSRTSSFAYRDKKLSVRAIADDLGVQTILEGSVRRAGNRIRVTGQLVDAESDSHLWAATYDRELEDIFAVQDEIAHNIVNALEITLSSKQRREIEKASTTDVQAYDYYLRARKFFYQQRGGSVKLARQLFSRAVEVDPGYALAHAGIAYCAAHQYLYFDSDESHVGQAEVASRRALELDPELAEAHASHGLALSLMGRFDEAEREFQAAIRIDPDLFDAHYFYARHVLVQGKFEQAAELFEKAIEERPEDYIAACLVAQVYRSLGDDVKATEAAQRALTITRKHLELNPDDQRAISLGAVALVGLGETEQGVEWADRALANSPNSAVLYNLACAYALAGQIEKSIDCLEGKAAIAPIFKVWIDNDSDLDAIRDHPRFQSLLKQMQ